MQEFRIVFFLGMGFGWVVETSVLNRLKWSDGNVQRLSEMPFEHLTPETRTRADT